MGEETQIQYQLYRQCFMYPKEVFKKIRNFRTNIYKLSCHYLILHYSSCGFILLRILRYLPPPLSSAFSLLFLWYYIPNLYLVPTFTICIYLYTLDNRKHTTAALLYGHLANKTLPHTISSGTAATKLCSSSSLPNFGQNKNISSLLDTPPLRSYSFVVA